MNDQAGAGAARGPNLVLMAIAGVALLAGLAVGGAALLAVVGVWTGMWEFGTGLQILYLFTGPWGGIIAAVCLLDGISILVLARFINATNGARMAVLAFIGALAAFLGSYIPESYRPDDSIPLIHDISTDTVDPPAFVDVLPLRADAPNTAEYGRSQGMTPEELARLSTEAYPDLVPMMLDLPPDEAFAQALSVVEALGWELVAEVPAEGRIEATDTTFWFRFKDDIVIRIRAAAGGSVVDARSVSRVGLSDAGKNAERLREFFSRL